ncbi:TonB-dependent receptor [Fulvitalea axinellae]|uniref:TonB-dependent receptor n=1 Tax=Fulvitalea axinellae TaxID=1182444 RepID=A0AAU9C9H9_9BACT|nr:TonB-dependent receptor [Fulvitalea axinellae]
MRYPFFILLSVLFLFSQKSISQSYSIFQGVVIENGSGDKVEGAYVALQSLKKSTITNREGIFQFSIPANLDTLTVTVTHVAYKSKVLKVGLPFEGLLNIKLIPNETELKAVTVEAGVSERKTLSETKLSRERIKELAMGFGEADPLATLRGSPGVVTVGDLGGAWYVRGGHYSQNAVLWDGVPLINPQHLLGILSVFNPDAIESVSLRKDGFPVSIGGSLSSFLEVEGRSSPDKAWLEGGVGLLSSRLSFSGEKGDTQYSLGVRRSYYDAISKPYNSMYEDKEGFDPLPEYSFTDINGKVKHKWNERLTQELGFFLSYDDLDLKNENSISIDSKWGNAVLSNKFEYDFSEKERLTLLTGYSAYRLRADVDNGAELAGEQEIDLLTGKATYQNAGFLGMAIKAGAFATQYGFETEKGGKDNGDFNLRDFVSTDRLGEYGAFFSLGNSGSEPFFWNAGLRSVYYANDSFGSFHVLPRLLAGFGKKKYKLRLSYDETVQARHMVSLLGFSMPTDIWYPAQENLPPSVSRQLTLSGSYKLGFVDFDAGVFAKKQKNISDLRDGAQGLSADPTQNLAVGNAEAFGLEVQVKAELGKWRLEGNYTLSRAEYDIRELNDGKPFAPPHDIRHSANIQASWRFAKKWTANMFWYFSSGYLTTVPEGISIFQVGVPAHPKFVPVYGQRYNYRMPDSHRMDLSVQYVRRGEKGKSVWSFGIHNLYNRANPYFIFFGIDRPDDGHWSISKKTKSLLPLIPSVSYSFELYP